MKRKIKTYTKKWKTGLNPISAWSSHFALLKLVFTGQNQKGESREDWESKRSPN